MERCVFCRIVAGQSPAKIVYQDEQAIGFVDTNPQAPTHLLVIPRQHLASVADAAPDDGRLLGHLLLAAGRVAREAGLDSYRLVINTGPLSGQTVYHIHVHVIGGRPMRWPPG